MKKSFAFKLSSNVECFSLAKVWSVSDILFNYFGTKWWEFQLK